eukprot:403335228
MQQLFIQKAQAYDNHKLRKSRLQSYNQSAKSTIHSLDCFSPINNKNRNLQSQKRMETLGPGGSLTLQSRGISRQVGENYYFKFIHDNNKELSKKYNLQERSQRYIPYEAGKKVPMKQRVQYYLEKLTNEEDLQQLSQQVKQPKVTHIKSPVELLDDQYKIFSAHQKQRQK